MSDAVVVVNPPWTFYPGTNGRMAGPSYTIAAVAAEYRRVGCDVSVLDACASSAAESIDAHTIRRGAHSEEIAECLTRMSPDVAAISSTWTVQAPNAVEMGKLARECLPGVHVVYGGHDVTVRPEYYADYGQPFGGEIEKYRSLDELPLPAWDLMPLASYREACRDHHGSVLQGGIPVVTSRGCPYRCKFCTVHLSMGRKWRGHSPEYTISHLEYLDSLGFNKFHFEDDNLTCDRGRWLRTMELMADRGWQWDTPNGVRLDAIDKNFLDLARRSGCVELRVAPESASQRVVDEGIGKHLDIGGTESVAIASRKRNIRLCAFWVIGIPGETVSDIEHTLKYAEQLECDYGVVPRVSIATPFPGTDMLNECIQQGWLDTPITEKTLAGATHLRGLIRTPEFTPDDVATLFHNWNRQRGYGGAECAVQAAAAPQPI